MGDCYKEKTRLYDKLQSLKSRKTESLTCQLKNSLPVQIHDYHRWVKPAVYTRKCVVCVGQCLKVAVGMEDGIPRGILLSSQPLQGVNHP